MGKTNGLNRVYKLVIVTDNVNPMGYFNIVPSRKQHCKTRRNYTKRCVLHLRNCIRDTCRNRTDRVAFLLRTQKTLTVSLHLRVSLQKDFKNPRFLKTDWVPNSLRRFSPIKIRLTVSFPNVELAWSKMSFSFKS